MVQSNRRNADLLTTFSLEIIMIRILAASATLVARPDRRSAFAHVTLEVQDAAVGSTYRRPCCAFPRLRDRSDQRRTRPNSGRLLQCEADAEAGWTLETVIGPYAQPCF